MSAPKIETAADLATRLGRALGALQLATEAVRVEKRRSDAEARSVLTAFLDSRELVQSSLDAAAGMLGEVRS